MEDMPHARGLAPSRPGGLEILMSSEVRIDVERRDSLGASTKEGSELELVNAAGPMEADELGKEELDGRRRMRADN
jgi:hypothetical protein